MGGIPDRFTFDGKPINLSISAEYEPRPRIKREGSMEDQICSIKENMNQRPPNKIGMNLVLSIDDYKKANVITDVYVLVDDSRKKCRDVCVMILKDPVKFKGEIVPGVKLKDLNVINPV
jgi:hypothetical protein